jgi:hypothetical protein
MPAMNPEWVHVIIGVIGLIAGGAGGIFAGGWRMGRIEGRLKLHFQTSLAESEQRFLTKVEDETHAFEQTLLAMRQKINDVEMDVVKNYVAKGDFDDFRLEYREDMRDLKKSIADMARKH